MIQALGYADIRNHSHRTVQNCSYRCYLQCEFVHRDTSSDAVRKQIRSYTLHRTHRQTGASKLDFSFVVVRKSCYEVHCTIITEVKGTLVVESRRPGIPGSQQVSPAEIFA
jgi:hypothetical protein